MYLVCLYAGGAKLNIAGVPLDIVFLKWGGGDSELDGAFIM